MLSNIAVHKSLAKLKKSSTFDGFKLQVSQKGNTIGPIVPFIVFVFPLIGCHFFSVWPLNRVSVSFASFLKSIRILRPIAAHVQYLGENFA